VIPSNVLDWNNETGTANMYGCQPCPKCRSVYRFATQDDVIRCDDCGHAEPAAYPDRPEEKR
jgi:ssDNA-binding Zn-finger/Zn-ribbon topoisomerase 1